MADCLVYYAKYWEEKRVRPNPERLCYLWWTKNEDIRQQIERGENLWAVVREHEKWMLFARLTVEDFGTCYNKDNDFQVIIDNRHSQFFQLANQTDLSPTLKRLQFISNRPIKAEGAKIGQTFQIARPLTLQDITLLRKGAKSLKSEPVNCQNIPSSRLEC